MVKSEGKKQSGDDDSNPPSPLLASLVFLVPIIAFVAAGIFGFLQKEEGFTKDSLHAIYTQCYDQIASLPLFADKILVNWWFSWRDAGQSSFLNSVAAFQSISTFVYLTVKPIAYILYYVLIRFSLQYVLYRTVLMGGLLSPTAVNQVKGVFYQLYLFQKSLTWEQLLGEAAAILLGFGFYKAYGFLKQQMYVKKVKVWYRKQRRKVSESYQRGIDRISKVSSVVATMTPHALFGVSVFLVKLLLPKVLTWIACETALNNILHWYYPVVATVLLLQDIWEDGMGIYKKEKKQEKTGAQGSPAKSITQTSSSSKENVSPQMPHQHSKRTPTISSSRGLGASTKKSAAREEKLRKLQEEKRKNRSVIASLRSDRTGTGFAAPVVTSPPAPEPDSLEGRTQFWLHYWVIVTSMSGVKHVLTLLPMVGRVFRRYAMLSSILQQVELVFWVWLNIMPTITITQHQGRPLIEYLACQCVQPLASKLYTGLNSVVTMENWNSYVVQNASKIMIPLTWSKILSQQRADTLLHLLTEFRVMLIPSVLVMSWPVSSYGVAYAQYGLPLAKSSKALNTHRTHEEWLQCWVLHALMTVLVYKFQRILWWIPFSNMVIFGTFSLLSIVQGSTVRYLYQHLIQHELQAFGILSTAPNAEGAPSIEETKIVRMANWVLSKLPSADDSPMEDEEETGMNGGEEKEDVDDKVVASFSNDDDIAEKKENAHVVDKIVTDDISNDIAQKEEIAKDAPSGDASGDAAGLRPVTVTEEDDDLQSVSISDEGDKENISSANENSSSSDDESDDDDYVAKCKVDDSTNDDLRRSSRLRSKSAVAAS